MSRQRGSCGAGPARGKHQIYLPSPMASKAHCPLGNQADTGKGVTVVTQEGILLRKYYAMEAPCTEVEVSTEKETPSFPPALSGGVEF